MSVLELFCAVDDFCVAFFKEYPKQQVADGRKHRQRARSLCESEIMTILILFHQSNYRTFKAFYTEYVCEHMRAYFPHLVSYTRFVEFTSTVLMPLCAYLKHCFGNCTGISFLDATTLHVCNNRRIAQHRVFDGLAKRGKSSMGWFFGFKLHLIFNDRGELLRMTLTPGNVDDRTPVPDMVRDLFGKLYADKGYISQPLFEQLFDTYGVQLITGIKKNMKNRLLPLFDKLMLRKRSIVETIIDQLKNISQIEHTRHRSFFNFMANLLCGLIAYCHQPKKPSLGLGAFPTLVAP